MKRIALCLILAFLFVGIANAQTKSMTGTVVSVEKGMYLWAAIIVKVGNKEYFVYTECGGCPNVRTSGTVDEVGRKVTFYYKRIERGSGNADGEVKPTRIVEVRKTRSRKK